MKSNDEIDAEIAALTAEAARDADSVSRLNFALSACRNDADAQAVWVIVKAFATHVPGGMDAKTATWLADIVESRS